MRADHFDYRIVSDPTIFEQNRLEAHSDHLFYERQPGDCVHSLNGPWYFAYAPNFRESIRGFEAADYDCHGWEQIPVPAHIQMQGYGAPVYVNMQYPWDGHEEVEPWQIPEEYNPTASYVKYFTVPAQMAGGRLFISFQGVESAFALWLNGHYIGYSEDSFTPADFELTPFLRAGENKLAAQVFMWSAGSWCEDQDFFRFSGIFRDVFLYRKPAVHVEDLRIRTLLDDSYRDAVLEVTAHLSGEGRMDLRLKDAGSRELCCVAGEDMSCAGAQVCVQVHVDAPRLWSAESPYLYALELTLFDENGQHCETVTEQVGFRRFEIRDAMMLLNGKRIVFRGVNRHEFCAESGRVIDEEIIRRDLLTMKRNNINAVRTSHYPNQTVFYRLCDRYGIYVIDETNLETHGTWMRIQAGEAPIESAVPGDRPEYTRMILDRANSMYRRDKNHSCVLIWSCGNESFGGRDLKIMSEWFHEVDPDRPVHYEGVFNDRREDISDIESTMYVPVANIKAWLAEHRDKPYISCEYAHAMGNSCGALEKYTDLTQEDPLYQGGFIWDYIDQTITAADDYGKIFQAYGGDFGDRPHDGNFSGDGIVYGDDRTPSPKMQEVKYCYQDIKVSFDQEAFTVHNLYLFTNTDAFHAWAVLLRDGEEIGRKPLALSVEPGQKASYPLPFGPASDDAFLLPGEYVLQISFVQKEETPWAPAGNEIAYGQCVLCRIGDTVNDTKSAPVSQSQSAPGRLEKALARLEHAALQENGSGSIVGGTLIHLKEEPSLRVVHGWYNTGVQGDGFELLFSRLHAGLVSFVCQGRELLDGMVLPNFWRAMTDNDIANLLPSRAGAWRAAGRFITPKTGNGYGAPPCRIEEAGEGVRITYTYYPAVKEQIPCELSYSVTPQGEVEVTLRMEESSRIGQLPEFSVMLPLYPEYDRLVWYGPGPEETYPDRSHGKLGIYEGTVEEQMARYLRPQECGWKENVRWAKVTDEEGTGLLFRMEPDTGQGFSVLPWSPEQLESARHPNELPDSYRTYVRIGRQMGVGGDDTWGALVHPEYLLDNREPMKVCFSMKCVKSGI